MSLLRMGLSPSKRMLFLRIATDPGLLSDDSALTQPKVHLFARCSRRVVEKEILLGRLIGNGCEDASRFPSRIVL
jgi:hypothetical protein